MEKLSSYPYKLTVDVVEELKKRIKSASNVTDYRYYQRTLEYTAAAVAAQTK